MQGAVQNFFCMFLLFGAYAGVIFNPLIPVRLQFDHAKKWERPGGVVMVLWDSDH